MSQTHKPYDLSNSEYPFKLNQNQFLENNNNFITETIDHQTIGDDV